ncbi:MAG: hypothetical protein ACRD3D_06795 [Terriglobia bacterium]
MAELRAYRPQSPPRRPVRAAAESGRSYGKLVVTLVILAALAYAALQVLPPYVHNYELRDYANSLVLEAVSNRIAPNEIPADLAGRAAALNLPVDAQAVAVTSSGSEVSVHVAYTAPVNFRIWVWPMRLSVSASAPKLAY